MQRPHALDALVEGVEGGRVDPGRRERGGARLDDLAALQHLVETGVVGEVQEAADGAHQPVRPQIRDERAVTSAHVENPGHGEGAYGLAERGAGQLQLVRERGLRGSR